MKRILFVEADALVARKTRARAVLSSGKDLIAKPVLPAELCVKVITHLLKSG